MLGISSPPLQNRSVFKLKYTSLTNARLITLAEATAIVRLSKKTAAFFRWSASDLLWLSVILRTTLFCSTNGIIQHGLLTFWGTELCLETHWRATSVKKNGFKCLDLLGLVCEVAMTHHIHIHILMEGISNDTVNPSDPWPKPSLITDPTIRASNYHQAQAPLAKTL